MSYQKSPQFKVKINGTPLTVMADTGASVNLLDEVSFAKLRLIQPEIGKANVKIFPYGSDKQLTLVGKCQCEVETDTKFSVETFIVEAKAGCLVSWKSSQRFSLVQVVRAVREPEANKVELLVQSYSDLFEGLGKLKGFQVHLHVDKDVQPIAQSHRRVPFHVRKDLEKQLTRDEELGVIEKTEGPTQSSMYIINEYYTLHKTSTHKPNSNNLPCGTLYMESCIREPADFDEFLIQITKISIYIFCSLAIDWRDDIILAESLNNELKAPQNSQVAAKHYIIKAYLDSIR